MLNVTCLPLFLLVCLGLVLFVQIKLAQPSYLKVFSQVFVASINTFVSVPNLIYIVGKHLLQYRERGKKKTPQLLA